MKIAIMCCIHANLPALEAVEKDLSAAGATKVFCLGDVVGYGAFPKECVRFLRDRQWLTLKGNHEEAVLNPGVATQDFTPKARDAIFFTCGALEKQDKQWIADWPVHHVENDFELFHASPFTGPKMYSYIITPEGAQEAFDAIQRPWLFHGHTHISGAFFKTDPISYSKDARWKLEKSLLALMNVGSVGQPRDRDPRACYVIFDTDALEVEVRRVAYDIQRASAAIREAGLPEKFAERLERGV